MMNTRDSLHLAIVALMDHKDFGNNHPATMRLREILNQCGCEAIDPASHGRLPELIDIIIDG